MSEILSALKSFFDLTQVIKQEKLKSILTILIILTIVLVKPTIYYATLYIGFCNILAKIFVVLFLCIIAYKICRRHMLDNTYDHTTSNLVLILLASILIIIFFSKTKYNAVWSNILITEGVVKEEFFENIHHIEYFEKFYSYVLSNFSIVLLYTIEFMQTIFILYFAVYISYKLLCTEEPLKTGFTTSDFTIIIFNSLMIFATSPLLFSSYIKFWNNIF